MEIRNTRISSEPESFRALRPVLTVALLAMWIPIVAAQNVYEYKDSNGNPVYTDIPPPGRRNVEQTDIPLQQAAPANAANALSDADRSLLKDADRRSADLDRAVADMVTAFNDLRAAEARRDAGVEPIEGERQGRRFRPEYWQRQQTLKQEVEDARARLSDAIARRNALR